MLVLPSCMGALSVLEERPAYSVEDFVVSLLRLMLTISAGIFMLFGTVRLIGNWLYRLNESQKRLKWRLKAVNVKLEDEILVEDAFQLLR